MRDQNLHVRIALVSTPFVEVPPAQYGGTELIVGHLARELADRGHEVVLYATGDSEVPGVEVRALYPEASWPPNPYRELDHSAFVVRDLLVREPVDVIHANIASFIGLARFVDAPVVYTIHHDRDDALGDLYQHARSPSLTMVAISERQRELVAGVCDARVVHHGLDVDAYTLGDGGGGWAAFLGRFAQEKGVHTAIDVAGVAQVPLRLAGRPHWKDEVYFRSKVAPRLTRPGVSWDGEASHRPKLDLLGGAVATLFPIAWEEPFGLVMIESMLCGTPVLALPRGSAAEVVDEGITGWLVRDEAEMAWRLRRLAAGVEPFDRARCRARAAERFSVARMVDDYLALYQELAGARPGAVRSIS